MAYNSIKSPITISVPGISLLSTGAQTLFTPNERFYPISILFELTTVSGFVTVATFSLGSNSTSFNNIMAATALTAVSSANNTLSFNLGLAAISSIAASTAIGINVTVGAVATTYTGKFLITGIYD